MLGTPGVVQRPAILYHDSNVDSAGPQTVTSSQ